MRALWPKLLALGASSLLCLLLAEGAVRLVQPQTLSIWSHTRDGIVVHQADIRGHVTPEGKRIDTNSIGMRDVEHPAEKAPGTFRILLFGDSFMEAVLVDFEESLAALLAEHLAEQGATRVEVLNVSVSGWGTDDQLTYYLRYARSAAPDLVLVGMTLHNDLFDNLAMEFHDFAEGRLVERPRREISALRYLRQQVQEWLASRSHLYRLVTGSLRAGQVRAGGQQLSRYVAELVRERPSPRVEAGWAMTFRLLEKWQRAAQEDGAELALFLIPLFLQVDAEHRARFVEALELDPGILSLEAPQRTLRGWAGEASIPVLDLLPGFRTWMEERGDPLYLAHDGHWNERGHALAAGLVARGLVERGLVPRSGEAAPELAEGGRR